MLLTIQRTGLAPASFKSRLLQKHWPRNKADVLARKGDSATYMSYMSIIKQARSEINITDMQVEIAQTHFTKKGEMLFELKGEETNVNNFAKKLEAADKDKVEVRIP